MFPRKSITNMSTPTFSLDFEKVGTGILVIDFQGNIFMSSGRFQNLRNKFLFNLRRHSTLHNCVAELRGQAVIHLQWETTAYPNFGICDTTRTVPFLIEID
jgi:hypothetical protein